ncbi:helix-turn-helix domain-containing protein [Actinomadura sp. 3N407]|uniref:helix-turn-helix domain-containing protein n=1 Tax=Actinomadura sp. 3N407 TaxID=3457423 RepID=UPI003FCDD237
MAETMPKGTHVVGTERIRLAFRIAPRYAAGETIRDLAAETGRSYGFIHNVLKEAGVPLRRPGGSTRRMRD